MNEVQDLESIKEAGTVQNVLDRSGHGHHVRMPRLSVSLCGRIDILPNPFPPQTVTSLRAAARFVDLQIPLADWGIWLTVSEACTHLKV